MGVRIFLQSVGVVAKEIIKDYIENQVDEYDENFKIIN